MKLITVKAKINAPFSQVWEYWTNAHHVTKWNFASPDWHCPSAENNFVAGGEFHHLMAAKDGSFQFDFWGTYSKIAIGKSRDQTNIGKLCKSEQQNTEQLQPKGWQAILDNFKEYVASSLTPS